MNITARITRGNNVQTFIIGNNTLKRMSVALKTKLAKAMNILSCFYCCHSFPALRFRLLPKSEHELYGTLSMQLSYRVLVWLRSHEEMVSISTCVCK